MTNSTSLTLFPVSKAHAPARQLARRRAIPPQEGRAIEILGHAIEYLADEHALECRDRHFDHPSRKHPTVEAIELLMARSREVYFSCAVSPTLAERFRFWLGLQRA